MQYAAHCHKTNPHTPLSEISPKSFPGLATHTPTRERTETDLCATACGQHHQYDPSLQPRSELKQCLNFYQMKYEPDIWDDESGLRDLHSRQRHTTHNIWCILPTLNPGLMLKRNDAEPERSISETNMTTMCDTKPNHPPNPLSINFWESFFQGSPKHKPPRKSLTPTRPNLPTDLCKRLWITLSVWPPCPIPAGDSVRIHKILSNVL